MRKDADNLQYELAKNREEKARDQDEINRLRDAVAFKESAKTTTPRSRALTTISTRLKRKLKNSLSSLMLKILSAEEQPRLSTQPPLSLLEPRMITLDSWLRLRHFKEILMDN